MFEIRKDGYAVYSGQRERAEGFVGTDSATVYEVTANGLKEVDKSTWIREKYLSNATKKRRIS